MPGPAAPPLINGVSTTLREMDLGLHVTMTMVGILGGIVLVDILLPAAFQYAGRFTVALVVVHVLCAATTRRPKRRGVA